MPCMTPSVVWAHLSYFNSSSIDHRTLRSQFIKNWILYLSWMFLCLEKKHGTVLAFFPLWKVTFCHLILPGQHSTVNCYTILELHYWMYKRNFKWKKSLLWKLQNNSHLPPCTHPCNPSCCPSFKTQFSSPDVLELILKPVSQSLSSGMSGCCTGGVSPWLSLLPPSSLPRRHEFPAQLPGLGSPDTAWHSQLLTLKTELWNKKFGSTRWSSLLMNEIIIMRI